jgi:hypothetical protein
LVEHDGDVGDDNKNLKILKGSKDIPQTQGFPCPHANYLRLSGSLLLEQVVARKTAATRFC